MRLTALARGLPRLLPPLARGRDWLAAGLGAGLCLGAAEALGLRAQRVTLSPGPAVAILAASAASVALLALPLALATRIVKRRLRHSAVAGGAVGLVLLAPILARGLAPGHGGEPGAGAQIATSAGLAVLCGSLAAFIGARLERAGVPISGPPLWAAVSLLVVAGGVLREEGRLETGPGLWLVIAAVVLVLALLAALFAVVGASRDSVVPWPWSRTLSALALAAIAIALAPRLLPWVFLEPPGATLAGRHPDVLVITLGTFSPGEEPAVREHDESASQSVTPNLTLLAAAGVLYRRVLVGQDERGDLAWLRLPDGLPLSRALRARGYGTRLAGQWQAQAPLPPGFDRADAGESVESAQEAVRATVGGALLARFGGDVSRAGGGASAASRITGEARRRIVAARARSEEQPILLVVDYGAAERRAALLDEEIGRLLDFLADLGLDENARIAVAWSEGAPIPGDTMRVVLRPEPAALRTPRGVVDDASILASDVVVQIGGLAGAGPRGEAR